MIPFADKEPASKLEAPSTKHSALNVHFTSKDSAVRLSLKELLLEAKKFRVALRSWENVPWIRSLTKSPEQSLSINYSSRHYDQETRLVLKGGKFYAEEDVPTPGMKWATQPKLFALTQRSKLTSLVLNGLDMRVVADSLQEHALAQGVEPNPSLTIPAHLNRNVENIVPSFALESNVGIQALFPLKVQPQLELRRVDNAENEEHYEALPVARSDRELNWQYRKPSGESPVQDIRDLKGPSRWLADKIGVFKQPVFLSHFKAHSTAVPALYQAWTAQELVDLMPLQRMTEACHSPTKEDRTLRFSFPRFEILIQDGSLTIEERNQPTIFCPYEYGSLEYDDFYSSDLRSDLGKLIGSLKSIQHPEEKLHQFVAGLLELDDKIITTATLSDAQSTAAEMIDFVLSSTVPIYCKPMNSCQGNGILK
ncbi:MAG: hypothetical protein KDD62_03495, partial [Bdellovibrionales bacterium]|nr:hypothetical protein [Bdellovibrionales bacterium]